MVILIQLFINLQENGEKNLIKKKFLAYILRYCFNSNVELITNNICDEQVLKDTFTEKVRLVTPQGATIPHYIPVFD